MLFDEFCEWAMTKGMDHDRVKQNIKKANKDRIYQKKPFSQHGFKVKRGKRPKMRKGIDWSEIIGKIPIDKHDPV